MKPKSLEERVNRSISGLKETDSEGFKEKGECYWKFDKRKPVVCSGTNFGNLMACGNLENRKETQ